MEHLEAAERAASSRWTSSSTTPRTLVPLEVKSSPSVRVSDARHLVTFIEEYDDRVGAGVLVYSGRETYWLTVRVLAVPWGMVI